MGDSGIARVAAWRTPALRIEDVELFPGARLRGHGHDEPHLCFLLRGAFAERDGRGRREIGAGTLRSSPAGDEHDVVFRGPSRCLLLLIERDPVDSPPPLPTTRLYVRGARPLRLVSEMFSELADPDAASPLAIETLGLELLATTVEAERGRADAIPPPWLRRARERIADAPTRPPDASELAAESGYHPVYVARAFRRHFGMGLGAYARLVRAEYARRLLATTKLPLARVALSAGYADQSHMTRALRRMLHATPAEVRRRGGGRVQVATVQESDRPAS